MSSIDSPHIMIAEDDDDDFYIFSVAIEELSFTVVLTRAENGEILIKLLNDDKTPDILFLDLMLPGKDGRQCLKEIRANHKFDTLPVVMYSSLRDIQEVEFCYREGANLYVIKPSGYADLKEILERILSIDWKKVLYYPPLSQFVIKAKAI